MGDRDLLRECMASTGVAQEEQSVEEFQQFFCRLCWNGQCVRAEQTDLPWERRMATQVERLLTNPHIAAEGDPRYANIRSMPFKDLFRDAVRLEIANQRGDWQIPVLPGDTDPGEELETLATPQHTDQVDQAAKALAQALGKEAPELPKREASKPEPEPEPEPEDSGPPEKMIQVPDHFVRRHNQAQQANTDFPLEGAMVGGGSLPEPVPQKPAVDPWAVPEQKGEKISVGGTVQLGAPSQDEEKN